MRESRRVRWFAALAVVAVLAAGCGDDDDETAATGPDPKKAAASAEALSSPASELRSGLVALLQEHVYLSAVTTRTALTRGNVAAAAGALDGNSAALAGAVGDVFLSDGAEQQFLALWRRHIQFVVDYATGVATNDAAKKQKATADLDQYRQDFGAFLDSATKGNLTKTTVADDLKGHISTLAAVIDAQAKNEATQYQKLRTAAEHMPRTATQFAAAFVKQFADRLEGSADGGAASLRASLTAKLQEHVYLTGVTTSVALAGGDVKPASDALDENSRELAGIVGSIYGDTASKQFLALWRRHIVLFVDYTTGVARKDASAQNTAAAELDKYRQDFGAFLESATAGLLSKQAVADDLQPHLESLSALVQAQAVGRPDQFERLRVAAGHMPGTAKLLSEAFVRQFPELFG